MICRNCGTNVPEGMSFCHKCGAPLAQQTNQQPTGQGGSVQQPATQQPVAQQPVAQQPYQSTNQTQQPINQAPYGQTQMGQPMGMPPQVPMQQPKKKKTGLIIGIVAGAIVFVAIIATVIALVIKGSGIHAEDYINSNIPVEGYDGYGVVYEYDVIDYTSLMTDLTGSPLTNPENISGFIDVTFDKNSELSNGDTVIATISIKYNAINALGYGKKLKGDEVITQSYTISGLEEVDVFNPHDALSKVYYCPSLDAYEIYFNGGYTGSAGSCTFSVSDNEVDIYSNKSYIGSINFFVDSSNYSKDGTIQLETSCSPEEYLDSYGFVVAPEFKDITPEIIEYTTTNSFTQDDFDYIKSYADDLFENDSYYTNGYFYGAYFACNDPDAYDKNAIILVYAYESWWGDATTNYMAYRFEDFVTYEESNEIVLYDAPYIQEFAYDYSTLGSLLTYVEASYNTVESINIK